MLYRFQGGREGGPDGALPFAGLIADREGALYGTTAVGGSGGHGTVFKLDLCLKSKWRDGRENDKDHDHDGCPVFVSEE